MMLDRDEYIRAAGRLLGACRAGTGGEWTYEEETHQISSGPYLYATADLRCDEALVEFHAPTLAAMARELRAYFTVSFHEGRAHLRVAVSGPVDAREEAA